MLSGVANWFKAQTRQQWNSLLTIIIVSFWLIPKQNKNFVLLNAPFCWEIRKLFCYDIKDINLNKIATEEKASTLPNLYIILCAKKEMFLHPSGGGDHVSYRGWLPITQAIEFLSSFSNMHHTSARIECYPRSIRGACRFLHSQGIPPVSCVTRDGEPWKTLARLLDGIWFRVGGDFPSRSRRRRQTTI